MSNVYLILTLCDLLRSKKTLKVPDVTDDVFEVD